MRLSISRETLSLAIKSVKRKVGQKNVHDSRYRGSSPGSRKPIRKKSCFANDLRHRIHFSCCYQNIAEQIHCFRNVNIKMFLKLYTNFHAIDVQILCPKRQHQNVFEIVYTNFHAIDVTAIFVNYTSIIKNFSMTSLILGK